MAKLFRLRITWIWLFLLVATLVSWEAVDGVAWVKDLRLAGVVVMVIAFVKARYVLLDFMELRHAPWQMRAAAEGWCLAVGLAIVIPFWTGIFAQS